MVISLPVKKIVPLHWHCEPFFERLKHMMCFKAWLTFIYYFRRCGMCVDMLHYYNHSIGNTVLKMENIALFSFLCNNIQFCAPFLTMTTISDATLPCQYLLRNTLGNGSCALLITLTCRHWHLHHVDCCFSCQFWRFDPTSNKKWNNLRIA